MATNFKVEIGEIDLLLTYVTLTLQKGVDNRKSDLVPCTLTYRLSSTIFAFCISSFSAPPYPSRGKVFVKGEVQPRVVTWLCAEPSFGSDACNVVNS